MQYGEILHEHVQVFHKLKVNENTNARVKYHLHIVCRV